MCAVLRGTCFGLTAGLVLGLFSAAGLSQPCDCGMDANGNCNACAGPTPAVGPGERERSVLVLRTLSRSQPPFGLVAAKLASRSDIRDREPN
jgi:hypothetical protein